MKNIHTMEKNQKKIKNSINKMKKQGCIQEAIEFCRHELSLNPNNYEIHVNLGDLYLEKHLDLSQAKMYIDEAIDEYQLALESNLNNYQILYKLALAFYYKDDFEKSLHYFNKVLEQKPKYAKAYLMISKIYLKKSNFHEALDWAKLAVKYGKLQSSSAHYLIFNILKIMSHRELKEKIKIVKELVLTLLTLPFDMDGIKNAIKTLSFVRYLPLILQALYLVQNKKVNEAIKLYRQAIDKSPKFATLYCLLGYVYRIVGKLDDAICEYKMAIWLDSLNIGAHQELCHLYEELGDYDNAIITYLKLIEIQPHVAEYQSNLGNILYLKGDVQGAIARYENAITLNPNPLWTSVIAQTLGYVLQESGANKDAAVLAYQSAYLLTPKDIDIYVNLGSIFYEKNEYENALLVYRQALNLQPHNPKIHCNIAFLYWGIGNTEEAIKEYELAIKYDYTYDIAYNNLGVIYLDDLGRVQHAIELFTKAITYNPNYALAHYNLARSIALSGDNVEAAKLYQVAYDINSITNEMDPMEITDRLNELFN